MEEENAARAAYEKIREKADKNPCYLCEQVDCEGCVSASNSAG